MTYKNRGTIYMEETASKNSKALTVLTEGSIWKCMLSFAFPLFLGNLFQQLYNTADSLIVGNFLGDDALAAVSSSGSLIFLMVGFFNGIAIGAGVIVARYYGAKQKQQLSNAIHTLVAFGLVSGVLLMLVGMALTPYILRWMGTPENVLPNSILYFRIYFSGSIGFVMYNIFMAILQSVGDSKHPLQYLIISSFINIALDLLFIAVFGLGVGSAAAATVISQIVSALLSFFLLLKAPEEYRISIKKIRFDSAMLKQLLSYGLPAGLQNSIISIANVVVQSNINAFGSSAMAGCGAYSKIEGFVFLPITCFNQALTTFIGQNIGAQKLERVKKGAKFGILCSIAIAELIGVILYLFAPFLVSLFVEAEEVIHFGVLQARTVSLFYFLLALSHCMAGIFRGAGKSLVPMLVMLAFWCILRITYITTIMHFVNVITAVFWAYPLTWSLSSLVFLIYYFKAKWME